MMEKRHDKKKTGNRTIYLVLLCIFLAGAAVSIGLIIHKTVKEKKAQQVFEQLANTVEETEAAVSTELPEESIIPQRDFDWNKLQEENEDIYAWIYVPGTQTDYPVLQHATDDEYYLMHNLDGSSGYPGCIFTQRINSRDFTDFNTVLYGHNMKNGSMFGSLHEYEDNEFFEENSYIYIYTPQQEFAYEIFAAYEFSNAHLLYQYDLSTDSGRESYLREIMDIRDMNAHFREDITVDADSRIITLSTCIKGQPEKRYLVQGVLVEEKNRNQ